MTQHEAYTGTLACGLRTVHIATTSPVAWLGLAVDAGSRDDPEGHYGLAHFVEHTLFKGTTHRRACHILNRMERVGGELNAYTTKEHTMVYTVFPAGHLPRAAELLADLIRNSTFPHDEVERERDVVLEEAAGYRDTPADASYDDLEDLLFEGSGLGHNILGLEQHLRATRREHCADYLQTYYRPANMTLFYVGQARHDRLMRLVERHFGDMPAGQPRPARECPAVNAPRRRECVLGLHQAHTVVGAHLPGFRDPGRHALSLLANLLGGPGMNSLLNVELRERRGYVYSVETSLTLLTDCGMMETYLACAPEDITSSLKVVDRVTRRLAETPLTERQLDAAKRQYCGQLLLAADSQEWLAMNAGRSMLYQNCPPDLDAATRAITEVTPEQLRTAAEAVTLARSTVLTMR